MRGRHVDLGGTLPRLSKSRDPASSPCISRPLSPTVQRQYELTYGSDIKLYEATMEPQAEA